MFPYRPAMRELTLCQKGIVAAGLTVSLVFMVVSPCLGRSWFVLACRLINSAVIIVSLVLGTITGRDLLKGTKGKHYMNSSIALSLLTEARGRRASR